MSPSRHSAGRATEARTRLLTATLECAIRDGGGALSLQAIARQASVSKALVLYHYRDKEALLAITIRWLSERIEARESRALAASTATTVLEDHWRWLDSELELGELRALLELSQERGAECRQAIQECATRRLKQAERGVARIFALLELTPRLPTAMLASCEMAFRDGLVIDTAAQPERQARVAFDVFWLSLLSLTR